jgi:hypothetical protein
MTICNIKLSLIKIGFCCPLIQNLICYTLYFRGYIISFKYMPVKLFLVAEVLFFLIYVLFNDTHCYFKGVKVIKIINKLTLVAVTVCVNLVHAQNVYCFFPHLSTAEYNVFPKMSKKTLNLFICYNNYFIIHI